MEPLKIIETDTGRYSLILNAGDTSVDNRIFEMGHEPNGYFWEGIAQLLVKTKGSAIDGRFGYDPEGGMFCAYGTDHEALEILGELMAVIANDVAELEKLVEYAKSVDFEFDD